MRPTPPSAGARPGPATVRVGAVVAGLHVAAGAGRASTASSSRADRRLRTVQPAVHRRRGAALFARPDFYGLLAVQQLLPGAFLTARRPRRRPAARYAIKAASGALSVVLDNLGGQVVVALQLPGRTYRSAAETALRTSSSRGLAATGEISLGGQRIGPGAAMAPPLYRPLGLRAGSLTIPVAAHSAVIVRIQPAK